MDGSFLHGEENTDGRASRTCARRSGPGVCAGTWVMQVQLLMPLYIYSLELISIEHKQRAGRGRAGTHS